jgi:hypothetical protein
VTCENCGCSESRPCAVEPPDGSEGPCWWVAPGACSGCMDDPELGPLPVCQSTEIPDFNLPSYRAPLLPRRVA